MEWLEWLLWADLAISLTIFVTLWIAFFASEGLVNPGWCILNITILSIIWPYGGVILLDCGVGHWRDWRIRRRIKAIEKENNDGMAPTNRNSNTVPWLDL